MKYDLPFFAHYSTTHNEPRMQALFAEFGFEGYGRYWTLCEKIASSSNAVLDISSRVIKLTIARALEFSGDEFDAFISFLNAPDIKLVRLEDGFITTDQLQEDYQKVSKKRTRDRNNPNTDSSPLTELQETTTEKPISVAKNIQSTVEYTTLDHNSSNVTTTLNLFLDGCKNIGFTLHGKKAQEILNVILDIGDPSWFSGVFTYPEFISEAVQESEKYSVLPQDQKLKIFIFLLDKEDKIAAFPEWRKQKIADAAAQEKRRKEEIAEEEKQQRIDQARRNKPIVCEHCGVALDVDGEKGICPGCGYYYFFNAEKPEWEFSESINLLEELNKVRCNSNKELSEYFIRIWKQNPDVFNFTAKIKDQRAWEEFWKTCTYSESDIDKRMANYVSAVKGGDIDRRYIPTSPDSFVLNGWLQKSEKPFNKQKHRIANDYVDKDDISTYFTEIDDETSVPQSEGIDF